MSELLVVGVSHKTAPVELRERLALLDGRAREFLRELRAEREIEEAAAISTCNRTEVYVVTTDPVDGETAVLGMLARQAGIRPTELAAVMYAKRNCDVARQLFRVTSGLESMIVGEAEVQGQVKRAYELALGEQVTGPMLNRLFREALATGKRVRTETAIGESHVSVSSVAVTLAKELLGDLTARKVLLLGAGETSELTARALSEQGVRTIFVANRRRERALEMARRYGGESVSFDDLPAQLEQADIVVASTASPHPIVGPEELELVQRMRGERPLLLIDIAVPRDIDPACAQVPGVSVYDIDDLQSVIARNMSVRRGEARGAESIVEQELQEFAKWLGSLEVLPTIAALRTRADDIVAGVLAENGQRWETASEADRERAAAIARSVANRLLHEPTVRMRRAADEGRTHARIQVLRELFGLEEPAPDLEGERPAAEVRELRPRRPRA
jgi:glutamyl-tRNA reductase